MEVELACEQRLLHGWSPFNGSYDGSRLDQIAFPMGGMGAE